MNIALCIPTPMIDTPFYTVKEVKKSLGDWCVDLFLKCDYILRRHY